MKKEVSWWIGREWRGLIHQRFQWGAKTVWGKLTKLNGERVETYAQNKSPWQDLGGFRNKWQMCHKEEGHWGWGGQGTERLGYWMVIHMDPEVTWFRGQRHLWMRMVGRQQRWGGEAGSTSKSPKQGLYAQLERIEAILTPTMPQFEIPFLP